MYAIKNGSVLYDILDGSAYKYLEYLVLPPEVNYVNFTWKSGHRKYFYHFDRLETLNDNVLKTPTLSIKAKGRIPKEEKGKIFNMKGYVKFYVKGKYTSNDDFQM